MPYRIQHAQRLTEWIAAHPEYRRRLEEFVAAFQANPFDERLDRQEFLGADGTPRPGTYHYVIPDVPIPLVIEVQNAERSVVRREIPGMVDEPEDPDGPDCGERWARVLWPRCPDDVVPDHDML